MVNNPANEVSKVNAVIYERELNEQQMQKKFREIDAII